MAEETTVDDELLGNVEAPAGIDRDNHELQQFVTEALSTIRGELRSNRREAQDMTDRFDEESDGVDDILDPDNVDSIKVRARPFENPKITVWLKGNSPIWANHAWRDTIYPHGLNAYNGKVTTSFDVRPV